MVFAICTIITLTLPYHSSTFFSLKKSCMCVGGILYLPRTFCWDVCSINFFLGVGNLAQNYSQKSCNFFLVSKVVALATASGSSIKTKMGTPQYFFTLRMKVNYSKSTCGTFATSLQFV